MLFWLVIAACGSPDTVRDSAHNQPRSVPWNKGLAPSRDDIAAIRQWSPARAIMHLHSPWSHDACDGNGLVDGQLNEVCLEDLRRALCETSIDVAYLSDHPNNGALQPFRELLLARDNDQVLEAEGAPIAARIACSKSHSTLWRPGFEDELMPLGMKQHTNPADLDDGHRLYNLATQESIDSHAAAGGFVSMAHTEGKSLEVLEGLVRHGLQGVELFNLHAMFDPTKRSEDLGLDPLGWASDIAPFTRPDATGEPDLFFLAVFEEQSPSIQKWDALQAIAPVVGFAGTDAHQNVLPIELRDGERGDSYRRMLRWFSNHLLVPTDQWPPSPEVSDTALHQGRLYTAFEILGTPSGLDFYLEANNGEITEMGSSGQSGTIHAKCPSISNASPTNGVEPIVTATIFRNGEEWAQGCGSHPAAEPGSYRLKISINPLHLEDFLGQNPEEWLQSYPWVYTNPIVVH